MKTILSVFTLACSFGGGMLLESHLRDQPAAPDGLATCGSTLEGDGQGDLWRTRAEGVRSFFAFLSSSRPANAEPSLDEHPGMTIEEARALFEQALASRRTDTRGELLAKIALEVAPEMIPGVIAWAERIPGPRDRESFVIDLVGRWAEDDASAALAYVENLPNRRLRSSALDMVLRKWQSSDPEAAVSWILSRPQGTERGQLLVSSLVQLSYTDPERAFDLFSRVRAGGANIAEGEYLVGPMFMRWAEQDPALASQKALALSDDKERMQALRAVATTWGEQEPEAALAWVDSLPAGTARDAAWAAVVLSGAERDPEASMKRLARRPDHPDAPMLASSLASTWADQDPEAALAWARRLPVGAVRDQALQSIGSRVAGEDPRQAFRLAQEVTDQETREMLLRSSVREWALQDPQEAARSIFALAPSEARTQILADMVGGWTGSDPGAAAEFVERLPPGDEKDQAAIQLLVGLGYQDPKKAAEYLGRFPGKVTDEVVGAVVGGWAERSVEEVTAWVMSLPGGATQDKAREALSDITFARDPESAIDQVRAIQDEETRTRAAMNLMLRAEAVGDESAQELLRQSFPMPEAASPGESVAWGGCTCTCPSPAGGNSGAAAEPPREFEF